ncbi:MAG: hypothetical protein KAH01_05540 [Caldisericia bacterium]|nr:hypothetical protein [Caldisericia bacterium]
MRFFLRFIFNSLLITSLLCSPLTSTYSSQSDSLSKINLQKCLLDKVYTFSLLESDISLTKQNKYFDAHIQGFTAHITPGNPTLLFKNIELEIIEPVSVVLEEVHWEEIKYNTQEIHYSDFEFSPLLKTTSGNLAVSSLLPGSPIDCRLIGNKSSYFLSLSIYPLQFRKGRLHYLKKISFSFQKNLLTTISLKENSTPKCIIISPDEWAKQAETLKSQHLEDGCKSEIHYLSEIRNTTSTVDSRTIGSTCGIESVSSKRWGKLEAWDLELAKKIQTFLINAMEETSYDFITILGDGSIVPPSFYAYEKRDDLYNFIVPTDFFYMSPNGGDNNLIIEMSLGRIPARDTKELDEYLEKLSCWKNSDNKDWFSNISLIGGDLFHSNYAGELACQSLINKNYFKDMDINTYYASDGKCNEIETKKVFKAGNQGFVNLAAHGSGSEVRVEPGFVNAADFYEIGKTNNQPIVFSYSCMNGAFDTRLSGVSFETDTAFSYPTSFGEAMLFSPSGSIAYIGGSRINFAGFSITYDSEGLVNYSNPMQMDAMCNYFFKSYSDSAYLGDMFSNAMFNYSRNLWSRDPSLYSFSRFTLLGDPVLLLPHNKHTLSDENMEVSFETPIVHNKHINNRSLPFLLIDSPVIVKTSNCSKIIICNYDSPGEIIQIIKNPQASSTYIFDNLPSTRLCFKFLDNFSREQRYVFNATYLHNLKVQHKYSVIKEVRPNEIVPYSFEINNFGIDTERSIKIDITLIDEENKEYFSKTLDIQAIHQGESYSYLTKIHFPDIEGILTLVNTVSRLNDDKQNCTVFDTYKTQINCSKTELCRVGLPCNSYYVSKLKSSLNPTDINEFFKNENNRLEFCIFPADKLLQYSFCSLLLFDSYWIPWSNSSSEFSDLFEVFSTFCNSGGIILGCSPSLYSKNNKNTRTLLDFFGIESKSVFSMTNYSRFAKPVYISHKKTKDFSSPFYFVQTRANWEPFPECSWDNILLTDSCKLIGSSSDKRIGLLQNKTNRFFLSCTFLSTDINCIEDQTLLLLKEILISGSNCLVPFSTIFNY